MTYWTFIFSDPGSTETALEIFDLTTHEWKKQETTGKVPRMGQGSFFAVTGDTLYTYGGVNDENYFDDLYQLDLQMFKWTKLPNLGGPSPKAFGGMVVYHESLIMIGGVGSNILRQSDKGTFSTDSVSGQYFKVNVLPLLCMGTCLSFEVGVHIIHFMTWYT